MKKLFKFIAYTILGMAMTVYFLECCADQHSKLSEKYRKESVEFQRGE
jgi:hypothetical protein